jgi:hypothetical protein
LRKDLSSDEVRIFGLPAKKLCVVLPSFIGGRGEIWDEVSWEASADDRTA